MHGIIIVVLISGFKMHYRRCLRQGLHGPGPHHSQHRRPRREAGRGTHVEVAQFPCLPLLYRGASGHIGCGHGPPNVCGDRYPWDSGFCVWVRPCCVPGLPPSGSAPRSSSWSQRCDGSGAEQPRGQVGLRLPELLRHTGRTKVPTSQEWRPS